MRRIAFVTALLLGWCLAPLPAAAGGTSVQRFKTNGYAFAVFGDCPDVDAPPPPGTVCREAFVQLVNESVAIDAGGLAPPRTSWTMLVYQSTLTFGPLDEPPEESDVRFSFVPFVDPNEVTYDREHLSFASVHTEVEMSDGTTVHVDLEWSPISERFVFGNDGPALNDFGLIRHLVDECQTQVNQGHQKFRIAAASGTFDSVPVHTYTAFPAGYISFNHFVSIDASHGKTCP